MTLKRLQGVINDQNKILNAQKRFMEENRDKRENDCSKLT